MSNIVSTGVSRSFDNIFVAANQAIDQAPSVAGAIVPDLVPELREGESLPDFALGIQLLSRALVRVSRQLDEGDHRRKHVKNIERQGKEILEKATVKLRDALVDVRQILDRTLSKKQAMAVFEGRSALGKLKPPVIERVSLRLISLLGEPRFGWGELADEGHRITAELAKTRLQATLAEFEEAKLGGLPERNALLSAQGEFDRNLEEMRRRLRRLTRLLRGYFEGAGFEREAAALVLRRRATPKPTEEPPPKSELDPRKVEAEVVPGSALPGVSAVPAPTVPAEAYAPAVPQTRSKRRRARQRAKKAQQGFSPPASAGPAEG